VLPASGLGGFILSMSYAPCLPALSPPDPGWLPRLTSAPCLSAFCIVGVLCVLWCCLHHQLLHHGAFMVLLYAAGRVILSCIHHTVAVGRVLEAILTGLDTPTK
jgi:hypothetical protein